MSFSLENRFIVMYEWVFCMNKIDCYIEEYKNEQGILCARLRDKVINKKVAIIGINADKNHLLRFMLQAKINLHTMLLFLIRMEQILLL